MNTPQGGALRRALSGLSLALLLAGCAIGPDYQRPRIDLPPAYPHAFDSDTDNAEQGRVAEQWWAAA